MGGLGIRTGIGATNRDHAEAEPASAGAETAGGPLLRFPMQAAPGIDT